MRTLAIDLGTRRVGLALSDEGARFATPYDVLLVASHDAAFDAVARVVSKESVERVVVGLPLNMDDSFGPAAKQVVAWGRLLSKKTRMPVLFVDERLSSFAAEQSLNDRKRGGEKMSRKQKKERLDAIAAAQFLQAFLDGKLNAADVG